MFARALAQCGAQVALLDINELIRQTMNGKQNILWPEEIKWFAKSSGTTDAIYKFSEGGVFYL